MAKLFRVGFLVNHAKMIKKALNLAEEMTQIKGENKDAEKIVPLVKLTKGGKENELERNT